MTLPIQDRRQPRIIVIGAGIGGLAAALRLADAGARVTVVEAAERPGGKMRAIPSAAGPVDAGPTVFTLKPVFDALFRAVGERLDDHLELIEQQILARHWWPDGSRLDLYPDPERSAEAIRTLAGPRDADAFRRFSAEATLLFEAFDAPVMRADAPSLARLLPTMLRDPFRLPAAMAPMQTLGSRLTQRFADPRLKQLFGRYATYVGGAPRHAPALLALIWRAEERGVWRIQGGMARLAAVLERLATERGAAFRFGVAATRIEHRDGRVAGVALDGGERLEADAIVFNGDPAALRLGLLGDKPRRAVSRAAVAPRAHSAFVWAFAARPSGPHAAELALHNVFFCTPPGREFDDIAGGRMPVDPTLYVCAQDRGAGRSSTGSAPERFEIIMNAAPVAPEIAPNQDTGAHEEAETCRTLTFETLERRGLRFEPIPEPDALTTPRAFATLFPGSAGSLYGRSPHGMTAAFARPTARSRMAGLYLAGGGVHPGPGVPMAALSGQRAAEAIMQDLASTFRPPRTATPGGMSTGSPTMARAAYRSSGS